MADRDEPQRFPPTERQAPLHGAGSGAPPRSLPPTRWAEAGADGWGQPSSDASRGRSRDPPIPVAETAPRDGAAAHRRPTPAKGGSFLKELPVLLLIAFVLAFLLRTFVLQVFYIPSSSMEPTLQIDDRMVVEKLTYLVPRAPAGRDRGLRGRDVRRPLRRREPRRSACVRGVGQFLGVVPASARDFVKRVIGVEGDEIVIEQGQVFVNGEALDEPYVVFDDGSDYGPVTVPEGHLFFLGDNRPNSSDSRRSLGFVPRGRRGRAGGGHHLAVDHAGR
jgi:signal peptidase I